MEYDLNKIALMLGVTTRTLRNYMQLGLLKGEKVNGKWVFSEAAIQEFFTNPYISEEQKIKLNSICLDNLKQTNATGLGCFVMVFKENQILPALPKIIEMINQEKNVRFYLCNLVSETVRLCIEGTLNVIQGVLQLLSY